MNNLEVLTLCAKESPDIFGKLLISMYPEITRAPSVVFMIKMYEQKPNRILMEQIEKEIEKIVDLFTEKKPETNKKKLKKTK